jgi:hypothetical protein
MRKMDEEEDEEKGVARTAECMPQRLRLQAQEMVLPPWMWILPSIGHLPPPRPPRHLPPRP